MKRITIEEMRVAVCEWMAHNPNHVPFTLDWIHECERRLNVGHDGSQADDYQQALYEVANPGRSFINDFGNDGLPDVAYLQNFVCATAEQRLTAIFKTVLA